MNTTTLLILATAFLVLATATARPSSLRGGGENGKKQNKLQPLDGQFNNVFSEGAPGTEAPTAVPEASVAEASSKAPTSITESPTMNPTTEHMTLPPRRTASPTVAPEALGVGATPPPSELLDDENDGSAPTSITGSPTSYPTAEHMTLPPRRTREPTAAPFSADTADGLPKCKDEGGKHALYKIGDSQATGKQKAKKWNCDKIKKKKQCKSSDVDGNPLWRKCLASCRKRVPKGERKNLPCRLKKDRKNKGKGKKESQRA